jgi:uncharacterized membrane protein YagU involved in acid resistance
MTAAMTAWHRQLPRTERHPLPPREITDRVAASLGILDALDESQRRVLALAAHFGYGTAMGALYGTIAGRIAAPPIATGIAYGLGVWAASYLGIIPAVHIMSPATQHPAGRNAVMIASHIVWGAALGIVHHQLDHRARQQHKEMPT